MGPYARRLVLLAIAIVSALGFLYLPGINVESSRSEVGADALAVKSAPSRPARPLSVKGMMQKLRIAYMFEDSKVSGEAEIGDKPYWKWLPAAIADSSTKYKDAVLSVMPSIVDNGGTVTLEWKNIPDPNLREKNSDYIGLFCPSSSPSNRYIDYWPVSDLVKTILTRMLAELMLFCTMYVLIVNLGTIPTIRMLN